MFWFGQFWVAVQVGEVVEIVLKFCGVENIDLVCLRDQGTFFLIQTIRNVQRPPALVFWVEKEGFSDGFVELV